MTKLTTVSLSALAVSALFSVSATAQVAYQNWGGDASKAYFAEGEVGDEITLLAGTERYVQSFSFEYYNGSLGSPDAVVRFYGLDPSGKPTADTLLYESGSFFLQGGYRSVNIALDGPGFVKVPDTFVWTVSFGGAGATETGLIVNEAGPEIGSSYADFWKFQGGDLMAMRIAGPGGGTDLVNMNFTARVVTGIPEPSTVATLMLGLLGLGIVAYRRKNS